MQVNILMKNVVDVVLGGLTYWAFGYGLSYGDSPLSNSFVALGTVAGGTWFVDATDEDMGPTFVTFLFQLSFATTATTIVSGSIAERCRSQYHAVPQNFYLRSKLRKSMDHNWPSVVAITHVSAYNVNIRTGLKLKV